MSWELVKTYTFALTDSEDVVLGTGFFISDAGHLLTCAHVVEEVERCQDLRIQGQRVNLVHLGNSEEDDFAILQVAGYQGLGVPLSLNLQPQDDFLTIGYGRDDFSEGASIDGVITDINPQADFGNLPMLRLRVLADSQKIIGGYSGSPVFDTKNQCVVGMIAASDREFGALAIPLKVIQQKWWPLTDLINRTSLPTPEVAPNSSRIFISYRSQDPDLSLAQQFSEVLQQAGHQPFRAGANIKLGQNWAECIDEQLELCDYFLLLLSPQSATSEMVTEEVRRVKELRDLRGKKRPVILPIRVNFPLGSPLNYDLRGYLSGIQQREWRSPLDTAPIIEEVLAVIAGGEIPYLVREEKTTTVLIETCNDPPLPIAEPELQREPGGAVTIKSSLYVERPPVERDCYREIEQPGALIRVKAPRQMGKTSLMARILNHGQAKGYVAIPLSFQRADRRIFADLEQFLYWFCQQIGRKLKKLSQLQDYWQDYGSKDKCTYYFEECLLEQIETPLVLGLDEVDLVFPQSEVADDFFALLRSWYEFARYGDAASEVWEKLRLIIVHSTEVYVPLDMNQSPFNVGKNVELEEFNHSQVQNLATRYGLAWRDGQVEQLTSLVGGHPYLIRKALYHLHRQDINLDQLREIAPTEAGIYEDHLRRHLLNLQKHPQLASGLRQVVSKNQPVAIDTEIAFKLDSMGLIKRQGNEAIPRCDLYKEYFRDRLTRS